MLHKTNEIRKSIIEIISRMSKIMIILSFSFFMAYSVSGSSGSVVAKGEILINVINNPPKIITANILPEEAYYDSELKCVAETEDENPEGISYSVRWKINGKIVESPENIHDNDEVVCIIRATDNIGQESKEAKKTIKIKESPGTSRIIKTAMKLLGATPNIEKVQQLKKKGLAGITGYAIDEGVRKHPENSGFIVITVLLATINILLLARKKIKLSETNIA